MQSGTEKGEENKHHEMRVYFFLFGLRLGLALALGLALVLVFGLTLGVGFAQYSLMVVVGIA